jgi:hypothetical protein
MFLEKDLENPANRLKRADRKVLALLRRYEAGKVELAEALEALANPKGLVFLREQLAAAIIKGGKAAAALDGLVPLLASTDRAARTFAARILAVAVDIDFGYVADASESSRTEAVGRITDYLGNREKNLAEGQKFVGGAWRTPAELEALRLRWEYAREIRTAHFLLRTNVTKEKSEDLAKLLEAGYDAFRQFLGQEPGTENLPLRIFVFAKNGEYAQWCKENGWERASSFYQLLIGERQLGLTTWQTHRNSGVLNVAARLFHRATFQGAMPMWYEEGFAAFFSKQGAYYWTPRGLVTGRLLPGKRPHAPGGGRGEERLDPGNPARGHGSRGPREEGDAPDVLPRVLGADDLPDPVGGVQQPVVRVRGPGPGREARRIEPPGLGHADLPRVLRGTPRAAGARLHRLGACAARSAVRLDRVPAFTAPRSPAAEAPARADAPAGAGASRAAE